MSGVRKRNNLKSSQLFMFTYAAHTSSLYLFYLCTLSQLNSCPYACKIYASVEIHPKGNLLPQFACPLDYTVLYKFAQDEKNAS